MKALVWMILAVACFSVAVHAGTIVYSYDEQHRLAGVNYGNQAMVTYEYLPALACVAREQAGDKANNPPWRIVDLTGFTVLTDSRCFEPFLFCFILLRDDLARPKRGKGGRSGSQGRRAKLKIEARIPKFETNPND